MVPSSYEHLGSYYIKQKQKITFFEISIPLGTLLSPVLKIHCDPEIKRTMATHTMAAMIMKVVAVVMMLMVVTTNADDKNDVFNPCSDSKVQKSDGFTFGLAFSTKDSFFFNQVQLSPCDGRLALASKNAQLSLFRPKVDEISLLTINSSTFDPAMAGGFMVAFAGRKYAARSVPVMVADSSNTITSFTLVLEFQEGTLQNLYWKSSGCDSCSGKPFVCLNNQDCAVATSQCKGHGGAINCDLNIQLAFSGTDKNLEALNSWYEVSNLRQYSLYGLFSDIRDSITNPFDKLI